MITNKKLTLSSYKMTHNTGFTPNVSGDILGVGIVNNIASGSCVVAQVKY